MKVILALLILLISLKINAQKTENLYTKDGIILGNKTQLINQCVKGIKVKSDTNPDEKIKVCECNLNLISKFYTAKELRQIMDSGQNPYMEIFKSKNPEILEEFKQCSSKYIKILDQNANLTTMTKNFSDSFIMACQYQLNNDISINKENIDIIKYCECLDNEYSKKGITISNLKEFQDENSVSYNEILQNCINKKGVIKNKKEQNIDNDVSSTKKNDYIDVINNSSSYKVKISFEKISKYFIIDSGASDTSISVDLERDLLLDGIIKKENYLEDGYYTLADGREIKCKRIMLNNIKIGDFFVNNVIISIKGTGNDLLLGKSFLNKFKKWSINNEQQNLYLEKEDY